MIKRIFFAVFLCGVLSFSGSLWAAEAGVLKTVQGQVQIERAGALIEGKVGTPVQEGDRVRVLGDGSAGISMKDETLLSLGPNSSLVISLFNYDPTTRSGQVETSILKGTLRFVTGFIGRAKP